MIEFRMLGQVDLRDPAGVVLAEVLRLPKRIAILAYLASPMPGTWHRRDTLLAIFWPERDQLHARTALRNAIYTLRQHLGDDVIVSRGDEELAIDPARLRTDLADVRAALMRCDAVAALAACGGDLLPGFHAMGAPGFEHWLDAERERLRATVTEAGRAQAAALAERGDLNAAIGIVRRVLEIAPQDERAVRMLIAWHGDSGDRAAGLRAFEEYRAFLAREFETTPSAETVAAAARLREPVEAAVASESPERHRGPVALPREALPPPSPARRVPMLMLSAVAVGVIALALALGRWQHRSQVTPEIGASVPVTSDPGLQVEPAISPNGRLVAYAAGTVLDLRIHVVRLEGGDPWSLTRDPVGFEQMPRWSPDGDAIVFLGGDHAYLAPAVGGEARRVAEGGPGEDAIRSASWSPGGDSIAVVRRDSLLVVPRDGTGYRFVGRGVQIHSCTWSPTGEWIACVAGNWVGMMPGPLFGNRGTSAIVLFPATGGPARDVTGHGHEHRSPAWSDDGRTLWILSDRLGQFEAFEGRVTRKGELRGEWRRVGLEAEFLSRAGDRIAYAVASRRANVHSLPADPRALQGLDAAREETRGSQIVEVVRVSPDGRWLLFDSNAQGSSDIYRRPISGGRTERLTDDPREEFAVDQSPDGQLIAYHRWDNSVRRVKIRRLADGAVSEPVPRPGDQGVPRWSPDGTRLVYWDHGYEPGAVEMLAADGSDGWRRVWRLDGVQLPAWRPDGHAIGVVRADGAVWLIPSDSGAPQVLHAPSDADDAAIITFLAWDPARPLLWVLGHDRRNRSAIWVMPAQGGPVRKVVDLMDSSGRENGPTIATDGVRLYFTLEERVSNVRWTRLLTR